MTARSKRAQVEALGWTFKAVPRFFAEGLMSNSLTGWKSPAFHDYKHPEAWIVTPPLGHPAPVRRFDHSSPHLAVRWAYQQATALQVEATGVTALVALMSAASASGVVAECSDAREPVTVLPDAELLNLCREAGGCDRIADVERNGGARVGQPDIKMAMSRLSEACRTKARIMPQIVEIDAVTAAGVVAKAEAIGTLFNGTGLRAEAVRSLVVDVVAVFGKSNV